MTPRKGGRVGSWTRSQPGRAAAAPRCLPHGQAHTDPLLVTLAGGKHKTEVALRWGGGAAWPSGHHPAHSASLALASWSDAQGGAITDGGCLAALRGPAPELGPAGDGQDQTRPGSTFWGPASRGGRTKQKTASSAWRIGHRTRSG